MRKVYRTVNIPKISKAIFNAENARFAKNNLFLFSEYKKLKMHCSKKENEAYVNVKKSEMLSATYFYSPSRFL